MHSFKAVRQEIKFLLHKKRAKGFLERANDLQEFTK